MIKRERDAIVKDKEIGNKIDEPKLRRVSDFNKTETGLAYCEKCKELFVDDLPIHSFIMCPNCKGFALYRVEKEMEESNKTHQQIRKKYGLDKND